MRRALREIYKTTRGEVIPQGGRVRTVQVRHRNSALLVLVCPKGVQEFWFKDKCVGFTLATLPRRGRVDRVDRVHVGGTEV